MNSVRLLLTGSLFVLAGLLLHRCSPTSKSAASQMISNDYKDVLILAQLIQVTLRQTEPEAITLAALLAKDSLHRISENFAQVTFQTAPGHIAATYRFSDHRKSNPAWNNAEKNTAAHLKWVVRKTKPDRDGEIQFDFGERGYHIKKIILYRAAVPATQPALSF